MRFPVVAFAAVLACASVLPAQQKFDSPQAAADALIDATSAHDAAKLTAIFGPGARGILTSGNPEQDRSEQTRFSSEAAAKHQIEPDPRDPNRAILSIGDDDWPFPVPLVRTNGKWSFDASETPAEMRARRIGTNELDAIAICQGYVEAQKKYASEHHDGDAMLQYASRMVSSPGKQNGLYSETAGDPLVPKAFAEAVQTHSAPPAKPYHGYYFRTLDAQGPHAPGGSHTYVAGGKLIGGFGLVAWPARYGVTGVHTFIVNQNGVVYEKDLPPAPGIATTAVRTFDPDDSWTPID